MKTMFIDGAISARNEKHATVLLMVLIEEGILDSFELDGCTDLNAFSVDKRNAYVDNEGYLTMAEDMTTGNLSDLIVDGYPIFGFKADYIVED